MSLCRSFSSWLIMKSTLCNCRGAKNKEYGPKPVDIRAPTHLVSAFLASCSTILVIVLEIILFSSRLRAEIIGEAQKNRLGQPLMRPRTYHFRKTHSLFQCLSLTQLEHFWVMDSWLFALGPLNRRLKRRAYFSISH